MRTISKCWKIQSAFCDRVEKANDINTHTHNKFEEKKEMKSPNDNETEFGSWTKKKKFAYCHTTWNECRVYDLYMLLCMSFKSSPTIETNRKSFASNFSLIKKKQFIYGILHVPRAQKLKYNLLTLQSQKKKPEQNHKARKKRMFWMDNWIFRVEKKWYKNNRIWNRRYV